jgi:hypothetical protein
MKSEREREEQASEWSERSARLKETPETRPTDLTENITPHERKRHIFSVAPVSERAWLHFVRMQGPVGRRCRARFLADENFWPSRSGASA